MQLLPNLDNILYNVQRQGKISFYVRLTSHNRVVSNWSADDCCELTNIFISPNLTISKVR